MPTQRKGAGRLRLLLAALVVTSISVFGAVGTASATPQPNTGVLEICKAASGKGVAGSFGFTIQGRSGVIEVPVDGCSFAITLPVGTATVTEVARPGFTVDAITAPGRLRSSNLATRTATVDIVAGDESNQTLLTFTNKATPKGYLEICKAKASGDDKLNGSFNFTVSQANRPTQTVTVPVGGCTLHPLQLAAGTATVTEAARSDAQLVSVTTNPPGRLGPVNLGQRTATVTIVAGEPATQTIVVFTNKKLPPPPPPTGQVKVCKRAGTGVTTGTFTFTLANGVAKTLNVKVGSCSAPQTVPVGNLTVMEKATPGLQVSNIKVAPTTALVSGPNLQQGTVTVSIKAGKLTEVEFTNRQAPPGTVKVCKVAGNGVVRGTPFSFTVGTTPVTVLAGSCSLPLTRPATNLTITEAAAGTQVTDITVAGAGSLVTKNLGARTATINVASGFVTEVIFTNAKPPTPVTGCLKPWKYFKHHAEEIEDLVPYSGLYVGSDALTAEQVHETLQGEHGRNPRLQLQSELITALLNQLEGASTPTEVQTAINAAQFYMSQGDGALHNGALNTRHSRQTEVSFKGRKHQASHLNDTLRDFNGGKSKGGPRPCRKPWSDDHEDVDEHEWDDEYEWSKEHHRKWRHFSRYCWAI